MLLAADIKRFLDRPAEVMRMIPAPDAPPGAPIGGDTGMDWLARPEGCNWTDAHPDWWSSTSGRRCRCWRSQPNMRTNEGVTNVHL